MRFITGPKSCLGFFYFTGRALLETSECCSWFPPLIQSSSNRGRDLRSPEEIGDSYQSSRPNKTQRRWEIFSEMFYGSRQNEGLFVCLGDQLELWNGCQVYSYAPALLPAYFSGVCFISGQKWQRSTGSHSLVESVSHFGNIFEASDLMSGQLCQLSGTFQHTVPLNLISEKCIEGNQVLL